MKTNPAAPRLVMCATTWSMIGHPSPRREWPLERKLAAIKDAGFDGVCAYINPEIQRSAARLGLELMSGFDCSDLKVVRRRLEEQKALGVHFINIQLLNHDTPPQRAAAMAVKLIKISRQLGLGVHVETHRDTCTETPEKFAEIVRSMGEPRGNGCPSPGITLTSPSPSTYSRRTILRGSWSGPN